MKTKPRHARWLSELGTGNVATVGGKNASLGEMYIQLSSLGVRVPNGFAVTAQAFCGVMDRADAWPRLHRVLDGPNVSDIDDLARRAEVAREIVLSAPLPANMTANMTAEILAASALSREECGPEMTLAVRSSATAEDLPGASFAGQHETFLNVSANASLLDAVRNCFASLFKDRAISYRVDKGALLPSDSVGLARMEFIVAEHIRVHPMALVHPEKINDAKVRKQIENLTKSYDTPADYCVRQLAEGVGTIAAAFQPRPVIVLMSDFKTNEYASLLGGSDFEPLEANR